MKTKAQKIEELYMGQPVAVLCARYWYRGKLADVGSDYVILSDARAVETTGRASGTAPELEDPIPSDILLSLDAVEFVGQPAWVWHQMDMKPKTRS